MGWVQDLSSHEPRTWLGKILEDSRQPQAWMRGRRRKIEPNEGAAHFTREEIHESKKRQYSTSLPRQRKMRIWVKEFFVALAIARYAAVEKSLAPQSYPKGKWSTFSFIVNFSGFFSETDLWARTLFRRSPNVERLSCGKMNACLCESER